MTRPFCQLILHYSVARLSWKTVKSLRNSKRKCRVSREKSDDGNHVSTPRPNKTKNNGEDVSPVEYEILQGWTIIAFHSLYVSLKVEYFVRFFIPFYFHLKMIVLFATFVLPSWKRGGRDGLGEFGLSPVISYWFDYVIVPGVHKVHDFMDHDPKGWAKQQLAMLPLLIINYLILPGVLSTEEELELVKKKGDIDSTAGGEAINVPPSEAFPHPIASVNSDLSWDHCLETTDELPPKEVNDDLNSTIKDNVDDLRNVSCEQESFATKYKTNKDKEGKLAAQQPDDNKISYKTPPRGRKVSSLFPRTTPNRVLSPKSISKKSFSPFLSPSVKSRLASSAMRLKRFSREHERDGILMSPTTTPRGYDVLDDDVGDNNNLSKAGTTITKSPLKEWTDENDSKTMPRKGRRKRWERLSLGDHFRELVTGDSNIRVRDHLFDLNQSLPMSPRRHLPPCSEKIGLLEESTKSRSMMMEELDENAPNITTRRSSRLAKKKHSGSY